MYVEKNSPCAFIFNVLTSIVLAVGIASVYYAGLISSTTALVYMTLFIGIIGFIFFLVLAFYKKYLCHCIKASNLLASSIGAIIISAFALAVSAFPSASEAVAIFIAAIVFFLSSSIIEIFGLLLCISCDRCHRE